MESIEVPGWNGNSPIFKHLIDEVKPKTIIEVGSWLGQSTLNMLRNSDACIFCVDTWLGALEFYTNPTPERDLMLRNGYPSVFYLFQHHITQAGFKDRVRPIPLPSNIGAALLKHREIKAELIYIDASHTYEDVLSDCHKYWELLEEGGIMFGDDYGNTVFEVKKAVDEFAVGKKLELFNNWFWIIRK